VVGLARDSDGTWIHRVGPEDQFVYVHVREFVQDTAGAFHQAVHLGGARGLILDLRGNPGGLLPVAVDLANMFLRDGLIAEIHSRNPEPQTHHARSNGTYPPVPVVVLIDEHSASGAELVAGALGHHARALLIGRRTRGKGLVQSLLALPEQAGYAYLTTSEFRIAGRSILPAEGQPGGVAPHVTVVIDRADRRRLDRLRQLAGLLPAADEDDPATDQTRRRRIEEILRLDNQLAEAIRWLRRPEQLEARLDALAGGNGED
jgi:carboxyl-terminal processing protease